MPFEGTPIAPFCIALENCYFSYIDFFRHDRFVVLDNKEVWHLEVSINGFGKDAFMINKAVDEEQRKRFLLDFSNWWSNGTPI